MSSSELTHKSVLVKGRELLKNNNIESYTIDARILLEYVLNVPHETLLMNYDQKLDNDSYKLFMQLIEFRAKHKPISQIIGYKEFYGRKFKVTGDTLIPRPETELIIDSAIEIFHNKNKKYNILDLGTGSGCLISTLLLEFTDAIGYASDISDEAINIAKYNAEELSLNEKINFINSNWFSNIPKKKFDLIVSNPPYIKDLDKANIVKDVSLYEPHIALFGGNDGLDPYRIIIPQLINFLTQDGFAIFEFGINQHEEITEIINNNNLNIYDIRSDLSGIKRCIIIQNRY